MCITTPVSCTGRLSRPTSRPEVEKLVRQLRPSSTSDSEIYDSINVLCRLCTESGANAMMIAEAGAVPLVVEVVDEFWASAGVIHVACELLSSLAFHSPAHGRTITSAGALPLLIAAFHTHSGNEAVIESVCRALCNLCVVGEESKEALIKAGVVTKIVAILEKQPSSTLAANAWKVLSQLSRTSGGRAIAEAGVSAQLARGV